MNTLPTTPREILELALRKEREAFAFYDTAAGGAHVPPVRDLLLALKDEEARHIRMVEEKLTTLRLQSEA